MALAKLISYRGAQVACAPANADAIRYGLVTCPAVSLDGAEPHFARIGVTCPRDNWLTFLRDAPTETALVEALGMEPDGGESR